MFFQASRERGDHSVARPRDGDELIAADVLYPDHVPLGMRQRLASRLYVMAPKLTVNQDISLSPPGRSLVGPTGLEPMTSTV